MAAPAIVKPGGGTLNAASSAALQAAWDSTEELVVGYHDHTVDGIPRSAAIYLRRSTGKYLFQFSATVGGLVVEDEDPTEYSTLANACDAAAAFLDTETDP